MIYPYIYINGEIFHQDKALIPVYDLGLLRGLGIFDYFRVLDGIPVFAEDHIERLENSLRIMDFQTGISTAQWHSLFFALIKANNVQRAGCRVVVTGGFSDDGYSIPEKKNVYMMLHGLPVDDPQLHEKGVSLISTGYQRDTPVAKTTVYIESMKVQPQMKAAGAFEILYHWNGEISECSRCNIFFITPEGTLVTPAKGMLKGVTRKQVFAIAAEHNLVVEERPVHLEEVPWMAGAFLTATTKGVLPVVKIDEMIINKGIVHPLAKELHDWYLQRVDNYLDKARLTHK